MSFLLCESYAVCRQDLLNSISGINKIVNRYVERDKDPLSLIHAQLVYELVMVRDGVFSLSDKNLGTLINLSAYSDLSLTLLSCSVRYLLKIIWVYVVAGHHRRRQN